MKPIKIIENNQDAIEKALAEANGRASRHAFTTYDEIKALATAAERRLKAMGLPACRHAGARYVETSGDAVTKSYARKGYSRAATIVCIVRRPSGWFMEWADRTRVWQEGGGPASLVLTSEQSGEAVGNLKSTYCIAS